jgi:hypothetical protein
MKDSRPYWLRAIPVVGLGIALFVVVGVLYELGGPSGHRLLFVALLASLGGLFGSSLALDGRSDLAVTDAPLLRVAVSAVFGCCATLVAWRWLPGSSLPLWLSAGAIAGCILGWFGWGWAKHVNF